MNTSAMNRPSVMKVTFCHDAENCFIKALNTNIEFSLRFTLYKNKYTDLAFLKTNSLKRAVESRRNIK